MEDVDCVVLAASIRDSADLQSDRFNELLKLGRLRKLLVGAVGLTFVPAPLDIVRVNSEWYKVQGEKIISPAGTPVLYVLFIERTTITAEEEAAIAA
jgi:hypothetical protein